MNYMGIDQRKQYSHMTLMNKNGKVLKAGSVEDLRNEVKRLSR